MADKQPLRATFFAFRKRERGGVLFGATVAYVALLLVMVIAFAAFNFAALGQFMSWYGGVISSAISNPSQPPNYASVPSTLGGFFLSYLLFVFLSFILLASWEASCLRWMVRGERGGFLGLTFGADMWRVYAGYWLWAVMIVVVLVVLSVIAGLLVGMVAMTMRDNPWATGLAAGLLPLFVYGGLGIFSVRFAPAAATSIGLGRFAFFEAWTVTRGRFWALFGSFFLLWLLYIILIIVLYVLAVVVLLGSSGLTMASMQNDPSAIANAMAGAFAVPAVLAGLAAVYLLYLGFVMMFIILMFGVNARAVVAAAEEGKVPGLIGPAAETFS